MRRKEGLRLRVLGAFEVEGLDAQRLGSRKARTLLKLLALARGAPVPVDRIVDTLWADDPPARPGDQVAVLVSRLRSVLGADRLVRQDAGYTLRVDWMDLVATEELVAEAGRRLAADSPVSARAAADAALTLLRGPLLADEPDDGWVMADRAAAERLVASARRLGAEAALAAGDPQAAMKLAEEALDRDAYDEVALRLAMAGLTATGRSAAALALYERVRARITDDLGVDPSAETRAVHLAILKGEPLPGIRVAAATATRPQAEAVVAEALPGRAQALAALDAALERVRHHGFEMVGVDGEAGIGKTRLLDTWASHALRAGARMLVGRCDELGRALPLQPVLDALDAHLRSLDAREVADVLGPDRALLAPLLRGGAAVAPGEVPAAFETPFDPGARQALLFASLAAVLERLASNGPAVLMIDDLHLAGPSTFEWLRFVARRPPAGPVLVVVSRRLEEGPRLDPGTTVSLAPLDLAAAGEVVGRDAAPALHARSGGNPLFLVELARAAPGGDLPASLTDAVVQRCERAGPAATTLRTAAVIGPDVDLELLALVLHEAPPAVLDHLEEGVRRQFLEVRESTFAFRHALVREALVSATSAPRRALVHRDAAAVLAARVNADPLVVAYHARAGGDADLEASALVDAARVAMERYDYIEAERLLDRAITLRDSPPSLLARGRLRVLAGRYADAAADAGVALVMGAGPAALEVAGFAAYFRRDFPTARSLAEQGLRLATDGRLRTSFLMLAGRERHGVGDLREAERVIEEAVSVARAEGMAVPAVWLALLRVHQGRPAEALELIGSAAEDAALRETFFATLHVHFGRALAYGSLGRCAEAFASVDALLTEIDRQQAARFRGRGDNVKGWLLRNLGAVGEADECNQRGLEEALRIEYVEAQAHALLDLAESGLVTGDLERTRQLLDQVASLQRIPHAYAWRHGIRLRLMEGRLALAQAEPSQAWAMAEEIVQDAQRVGAAKYDAAGRLLVARARAACGEPVDLDEVDSVVGSLDRFAGLESWWMTAEMAGALQVQRWWELAERRLAHLADNAGDRADTVHRGARKRLLALQAVRPPR